MEVIGSSSQKKQIPPGEGERRAQRGYVPQYALAARVIYQALASGRLRWVGLADRGAGAFDDVVLGLNDGIKAYQVKTSQDPEPFAVRTILLGAEKLLKRMLDSRAQLRVTNPDICIETIYVCDDYLRHDDEVCSGSRRSSAAFVRQHEEVRDTWSLEDWRNSPFGPFINDIQSQSALEDVEFADVLRHMRFLTGGRGHELGISNHTQYDVERINQLAGLLPRLVADRKDRDRWPVQDLLLRLQWRDPTGLRHHHVFPVDELYEPNLTTEQELRKVLSTVESGYVSLLGPPGAGKSTLLEAGLLPTPNATVIRYLAFVPGEGQGLGRAEALDFLHDLTKRLKQQNLGPEIVPADNLNEIRWQFQKILGEAGARYSDTGLRTLIVVDGLDHVSREEDPDRSFLTELPLPHSIPIGVVFILGTQKLDDIGLLPAVRDQALLDERRVTMAPLSREAVTNLAVKAKVPEDVDRTLIYARSGGHPLSTRYVIEALLAAGSPAARNIWLRDGPEYGGDVDAFYVRAWHDLEKSLPAQRVLAFVAMAEGPIRPRSLDILAGSEATDAAWTAARHLLTGDPDVGWSTFHNSFRLFLRLHTDKRFGQIDHQAVAERYRKLASIAQGAKEADPQRWMELRYLARAGDVTSVADLATPARFRSELFEGRNPRDIRDDISFAFEAARLLKKPSLVVGLVFCRHEIDSRLDALGDETFEAMLALGNLEGAAGLLDADGVSLDPAKAYELIDVFLGSGQLRKARELFFKVEPLERLLGSVPLDASTADNELFAWADRALAFRDAKEILPALARLQPTELFSSGYADVDVLRTDLKLVCARGQLERNPRMAPEAIGATLELDNQHDTLLLNFAAHAAAEADLHELAVQRLEALALLANSLDAEARRPTAKLAMQLGRLDLASKFMKDLPEPKLRRDEFRSDGPTLRRSAEQVFTHAYLRTQMSDLTPKSQITVTGLIPIYQFRLEVLGRILGEARAGRVLTISPIRSIREMLDFLQYAKGQKEADADRWSIDCVLDQAISFVVEVAASLGDTKLREVIDMIDERLRAERGRLGVGLVRRAYALAVFRHDFDITGALNRLGDVSAELFRTPAEQISEIALTASSYASLGMYSKGLDVLSKIHLHGLGYSRAPKKDPQYLCWNDVFTRASNEDPSARLENVRFLSRLIDGMSQTEGKSAARRIVPTLLTQAAQVDAECGVAAANSVVAADVCSWETLTAGLVIGIATRRPELASVAAIIYLRAALPFTESLTDDVIEALVAAAPPGQAENMVQHMLTCLQTDAHMKIRLRLIKELISCASKRELDLGHDEYERWSKELAVGVSNETEGEERFNEDTFKDVTDLEGFVDRFNQYGGEISWSAEQAFAQLVLSEDYDRIRAFWNSNPAFHKNGRTIESIADAAFRAGRIGDVETYLGQLETIIPERGTWGSLWNYDTKLRYYRVKVRAEGEPAAWAAFDCFAADLSQGREYPTSVLPTLCDILQVVWPHLSWAKVWQQLVEHLKHFREYRIGSELSISVALPNVEECTLTDILFRAVSTNGSPLLEMVRVAAREILPHPGGVKIVSLLVQRLLSSGDLYPLEGARIAWECRDIPGLRDEMVSSLPEIMRHRDFAVRRIGMALARNWGQPIIRISSELPASYRFELVSTPQHTEFEPPSGNSMTSNGLWTEDWLTWTSSLQSPLNITQKAAPYSVSTLRSRTAMLMGLMGGEQSFGPSAVSQQQANLRALDLQISYRKLMPAFALTAMRVVIGELVAAEEIDQQAVSLALLQSGEYPRCLRTAIPVIRPRSLGSVKVPDLYSSDAMCAWQEGVQEDVVVPFVEGYQVLAATSCIERNERERVFFREHYFGPDLGEHDSSLWSQLGSLDRVVAADAIMPLYQGCARGSVVWVFPGNSGAVSHNTVTLCPQVAADLKWRPDPFDSLIYLDREKQIVARTLFWRDGGIPCRDSIGAVSGSGHMLVVRQEAFNKLKPFIGTRYISRAWRGNVLADGDSRVYSAANKFGDWATQL